MACVRPFRFSVVARSSSKRFTKVLKDKAPDDYATLLEWFPLLEVDHVK